MINKNDLRIMMQMISEEIRVSLRLCPNPPFTPSYVPQKKHKIVRVNSVLQCNRCSKRF